MTRPPATPGGGGTELIVVAPVAGARSAPIRFGTRFAPICLLDLSCGIRPSAVLTRGKAYRRGRVMRRNWLLTGGVLAIAGAVVLLVPGTSQAQRRGGFGIGVGRGGAYFGSGY